MEETMVNYKEILYRLLLNQSQRQIRGSVHCSDNTIRAVQQAAKDRDLAWPLSDDITNAELEQLLFPNKHKASNQYAEPDYSPRTGPVGRDPDAAVGRILHEVPGNRPEAIYEYPVW